MATVLLQSPANYIQHAVDPHGVVPIGSRVWLEYASAHIGNATKAVGTVKIGDITQVVDGYYLSIAGVKFYFKTNPKPNECPAYPTTLALLFNSLRYQINIHPYLKDKYTAIWDGQTLTIRANKAGTIFNFPESMSQPGNAFITTINNGSDENFAQSKSNYGIVVELFIDTKADNKRHFLSYLTEIPYPASEFELVGTVEKRYGGENRFLFDLSEMLLPYTQSEPPFVNNTNMGIGLGFNAVNGMIVRYAYNAYEVWDENGTRIPQLIESKGFNYERNDVKYTLWGVRASERVEYNFDKTYISFYQRWRARSFDGVGQVSKQVYFLTHQPRRKAIRRDAIEYLYFIMDRFDATNDVIQAVITIEYEDCTTQQLSPQNIIIDSTEQFGVLGYIEVSPRVMNLDALEATAGKQIRAYFIQLYQASSWQGGIPVPFTVNQAYELVNEERYTDYMPTLLFLNPLGGFDSLTPRGVLTKQVSNKSDNYARTLQHRTKTSRSGTDYADYSLLTTTGAYNSETKISYKLESGWMNKEHMDWLRDLVQSTEIYLIDLSMERELRDLNTFLPRAVDIVSTDWARASDVDEYNLSIEVELTVNRNYLPS